MTVFLFVFLRGKASDLLKEAPAAVTKAKPNESVTWKCVGENDGWRGHIFTFHLDTNDNKTRVRFEESGRNEIDDFYASCNFSWGRYLESLRQLCQTGKGEAFGSEGYRK